MNLSEKPCYPCSYTEFVSFKDKRGYGEEITESKSIGLTLRERLVIALASNPQMFYMAFDDDGVPQLDWDDDAFDRNAGNIKRQADAIIKEMEK